jgi:hypothetical protein
LERASPVRSAGAGGGADRSTRRRGHGRGEGCCHRCRHDRSDRRDGGRRLSGSHGRNRSLRGIVRIICGGNCRHRLDGPERMHVQHGDGRRTRRPDLRRIVILQRSVRDSGRRDGDSQRESRHPAEDFPESVPHCITVKSDKPERSLRIGTSDPSRTDRNDPSELFDAGLGGTSVTSDKPCTRASLVKGGAFIFDLKSERTCSTGSSESKTSRPACRAEAKSQLQAKRREESL